MTAAPDPSIAGRRVLVVGASSGIGRAFAERAIAAGAEVALAARRAERLDEAITRAGGGTAIVGDVCLEGDCGRMVDEAVGALGGIDLVFHAAGVAPLAGLAETEPADWRAVLETNVIGLHELLRAAVPAISGDGIAAVLSSETVGRPRTSLGAYGASKAALEEMLRVWRLEHPEVRFACVSVGATQPTEFGAGFSGEALGPALESWSRLGLLQEAYMETDDVAAFLVATLGAALAFPGVGVEHLLLRSPTPVVGLRDALPNMQAAQER